jgi:hypothetical protein
MNRATFPVWEIPFALLSFLFYKLIKFIVGNFYTFYLFVNRKKASQWQLLDAETFKNPLALPVLMTKGPRWNTHAIIGTLGPFQVRESISLDTASANDSAPSWIAVVYSFPAYKTIASFEPKKSNANSQWASIQLKPGKYSIGLRYYHWSDNIRLPALQVDGRELVKALPVPADVNGFLLELIKSKNWFYSWLHYYIFTILRLRKYLPESFVKREYLPVGAPDTEFFYNYLYRGQALEVVVSTIVLNNYHLYFTLYERCSLPVNWCEIEKENFITEPVENDGFYLIRVRPKADFSADLTNKRPLKAEINDECPVRQKINIIREV